MTQAAKRNTDTAGGNAVLKQIAAISRSLAAKPVETPAPESIRIAEALIFASPQPLKAEAIAARLPKGTDVEAVLRMIAAAYEGRGINLVRVAGGWAFRTPTDLAYALADEAAPPPQKLSRAAMEVLSIIAYHQPATRAEIEEIRGVATSKGTLDTLLEAGWIRLRGRRKAPGRPVTFGTTPAFLAQFGLDAITDLPGLEELKGLGFLEGRVPKGLDVPMPSDSDTLAPDEEPLEADMLSVTPLEVDEE
ncbi:SMC-Scp complex subunit ScpB [Enterovirga rhinocerotis]|uniref:Segregation and condensation protein B n=1 Tax=Enterovirga rhinocerotis TaxID=1339210 RepID=A0A4R7C7W7_9HYPH|nr:SMC-Scp complex subunit ScpB [Enterovirga rhinocerotis]TDR94720.1 segregation and condensation protein B [Enterovirga rhinocerotis]